MTYGTQVLIACTIPVVLVLVTVGLTMAYAMMFGK